MKPVADRQVEACYRPARGQPALEGSNDAVRPDESENGQISHSAAVRGAWITAVVRAARRACPESGKSAKIHAGSGFIWRIPVESTQEDDVLDEAEAEQYTHRRFQITSYGADARHFAMIAAALFKGL